MKPRHIKNRAKEVDPVRKFKMLPGKIRTVRRFSNGVEVEDIFLDKAIKERDEAAEVAERKLEVPLKKINFVFLFLFGVIMFGVLVVGTFKLQVQAQEKYELLALQNKFIISYLTSERGIIYDRNREQLVWNEVSFDLWEDDVLKKENLSHQELILFETQQEKPEGARLEKRILRQYIEGAGLGHILGYTGKISAKEIEEEEGYQINDYIGKEGLERSYEEILREKKGELQIERTAQGEEISRKIINYPQSGDSLVLSLNLSLQKKIVEALTEVLQEVGVEKGAVVALNPRDGEILASVSLPTFDNNLFARGITQEELEELNQDKRKPQLNRVIAGLYPTGSAIKPLIAVAALEEEVISETTKLYCPLELCIPHQYTQEGQCFPDWQFHGWTDIRRAIAESVNPFFYIIGGGYAAPPSSSEFFNPSLPKKFEGLGVERIARYLELFGLATKTGIDLPGEVEGRVPTPAWKKEYFTGLEAQKWYLGDTYNLSIGQGYLLATPLQLASAFASLVNGGKLFKPYLAQEILDPANQKKQTLSSEIIRQGFLSQTALQIVKQGMRQAVSSPAGSAYSLNFLPVAVAAKTGTAQIYPKKEIYHNWVAVFAPYEEPEIVLVVLIEHVEGTRVAAQKVAKEILQWYFSNNQ